MKSVKPLLPIRRANRTTVGSLTAALSDSSRVVSRVAPRISARMTSATRRSAALSPATS